MPTIDGPGPVAPTSAYTVFATVTTDAPPPPPTNPHIVSGGEKLGVALGVVGGVLGLVLIVAVVWYVRRKHAMERESLAFSRLPYEDQALFLRDNPDSWLNPQRTTRRMNHGPPAPPGTVAYANWYWSQMPARQQRGRRWGKPGIYQRHGQMEQMGHIGQMGQMGQTGHPGLGYQPPGAGQPQVAQVWATG